MNGQPVYHLNKRNQMGSATDKANASKRAARRASGSNISKGPTFYISLHGGTIYNT